MPCHTVPGPAPYGDVAPLLLPEPDTAPVACGCPQPVAADLRLLREPGADALRAPADPADRARYRWLIGHHAAFALWQRLRRVLERALDDPAQLGPAARLYDVYSVLFLYTGSCSAERYAETIRPEMTARHPAFSGEWARDQEGLGALTRRVLARHPKPLARPLADAVRLNRRVHMAVAARLVPGGASLLQETGRRPGQGPTPAERDLYDRHFAVRRGEVCGAAFTAQFVRRLAQILCDVAAHGLSAPGLCDVAAHESAALPGAPARGSAAPPRGLAQESAAPPRDPLSPLTHRAAPLLRALAEDLAQEHLMHPAELKSLSLTPELYGYLVAQAEPPTPVQRWLLAETQALGQVAEMQIPHEQSVLLTLLTKITGARLVVEVGTFTGCSTLAFALGLPPGGRVITCDVSDEWTSVARRAWEDAGVADAVHLLLGPAVQTLRTLPEEAVIDIAFLDADKPGYETYWELLVPRLRPGGLLLADNVLYGGAAADPGCTGNAEAIRRFNARVQADGRVESVMLPVADGLTVARKRVPGEGGAGVPYRAGAAGSSGTDAGIGISAETGAAVSADAHVGGAAS